MTDTPATTGGPVAQPSDVQRLTTLLGDVLTLYTALKAKVDGVPALIDDRLKAALPAVPPPSGLDDLERQVVALHAEAGTKPVA